MYNNNKGFTITEALIGVALLSIVIVGGLSLRDFARKGTDSVSTINTVDNRVYEIIQSTLGSISQQIISFPDSTSNENLETLINQKLQFLPMAWSLNTDIKASECENCPGRYGYIITPVPDYPGLYMVTIRFTHKDWMIADTGGRGTDLTNDGSKKYRFLVTR